MKTQRITTPETVCGKAGSHDVKGPTCGYPIAVCAGSLDAWRAPSSERAGRGRGLSKSSLVLCNCSHALVLVVAAAVLGHGRVAFLHAQPDIGFPAEPASSASADVLRLILVGV
jgi:hypothetical protein